MRHELRRIDPLRAANVMAVVYGLLIGIVMTIFLPIFLVMILLMPEEIAPGGRILMLLLLVLYPLIGVVVGWLSGLLSCAIYNVVVRWTGGLLFELSPVDASGGGVA